MNPDEPSQFFWLDDAFGITQYESFLAQAWNCILPQLKPMLRGGAKIVMTSRDYIYNRARHDLKESAFPLLKESQVVIDVHGLSSHEKRQILYNHLKLGRQPQSFKAEIKPYLESVADHPRFIPEIARRLADPLFTKGLFLDPYYLGQFVEKREQLLQEVLQGLDGDSKAALALIYMRNGRLESPIELQPSEFEALQRLGSDVGGCIAALEALTGSLVLHAQATGDSVWGFKHPTIGDSYAATLVQSPEHLGIYIQGSTVDRVVDQVTCGDVGIEKAVVVPRTLFPMMLAKLEEMTEARSYKSAALSAFEARRNLQGFLAERCSREFLALYLGRHPELLATVSRPGLMLSVVPEVRLAQRLHEYGLLPEENRKNFVATVSDYASEGQDSDALDDLGIRSLFTDEEYQNLLLRVHDELLPSLGDVRTEYQSDHSSGESREEHMYQMLSTFQVLLRCFADDAEAVKSIEFERRRARQWIEEEEPRKARRERSKLGEIRTLDSSSAGRSIFDDVDADEG